MRNHGFIGVLGAALLVTACGEDGSATAASAASSGGTRPNTVFELQQFTGVPRPFAGPLASQAAPIRGVPGGGLPWVIGAGKAELTDDGRLEVDVDGLVFDPNDAAVIARGFAGLNNVAGFKAIVSCETVVQGANGPEAAVVNVQTAVFPATQGLASAGGGDAHIEQTISLPRPCIAPIVFVTSPTGNWFAASAAVTP